jgi:hypothetical protein
MKYVVICTDSLHVDGVTPSGAWIFTLESDADEFIYAQECVSPPGIRWFKLQAYEINLWEGGVK